jgi:SNF2 family DNA or RNA helicase
MSANQVKTIPESGQLVTLRGRRFSVTDVCTSTSSANIVRSRQTANHHLVKLKSIEDDDLGSELEVIWEADDVGLGKTIEAGLVAQEMMLRQRVQKILVVCPSSLQVQWQQQMRDKFGLDFCIVSSELMRC